MKTLRQHTFAGEAFFVASCFAFYENKIEYGV